MPTVVLLLLQLQFPAPVGFVNDFAGIIDTASQREMLGVIEEVRQKSGGEIAVVTLRDLEGRAAIDVARDIGREWGVGARGGPGDRARNAGVVLLLVPGERPGDGRAQLAIATGSGAEGFITDARAGRIRDAIGRASVEYGSYAKGLVGGVQLLGVAYAEEFEFELTGQPSVRVSVESGRETAPGGFMVAVVLFIILFALLARGGGGGGGHRGRRRRRGDMLGWLLWAAAMSSGGGGRRGGGWGGGGFGGGGFGGFGGGGGFSGGGASGSF